MKRITALIFALILAVSGMSVSVAATDNNSSVDADRLNVLYALGIIDSTGIDEKELKQECSRVQAAKLFCRVLGIDMEEGGELDVVFYDVSSDTIGYKYIKLISDAGYMIGYPDGRFRPTQTIRSEEAGRVLANMLGYKLYIEATGLDNVFLKTDITDGVTLGKAATYGEVLNMVYNALHAPACREVRFGTSISYEISEDYLGIEHILKVKKGKGILNAVQGTELEGSNQSLKEGFVEIEGIMCRYDGDASEFLGYGVDFYYKTEDNIYEIIYITKSNKNKVLVLGAEDIEGYSDYTYAYIENNIERKASISRETDILYNGVAYPMLSKEEMIPGYGDVTLIDNNGDNRYDVVSVKNVEFIVLDSVDAEKRVIADKLTEARYDFEEADELEIFADGKTIALNRLIPNSFLSMVRSKEDSGWYKVRLERVNETLLNVVITGVGKDTVSVAGTQYPLWDKISEKSARYLEVGANVTLYLKNGIVVAAEQIVSDSYGYLINVSEPEVFENSVKFRLMLSDAKPVNVDMGKVIKIDGTACKTPEEIRSRLQASALLSAQPHETQVFAQPVKYKIDGNGILTSLDTFYFDAEKEDAETSLRKLPTEQYRFNLENKTFYLNSTMEFKAVGLEQSFKIPTNDRYSTTDYQYRWLSDNGTYWVDICNVDEISKQAEKVYVYITSYASGVSKPYLVTRTWKELDENGDVQLMVEYATSGSKSQRVCVDYAAESFDSLNVGDIIRVDYNINSDVRAFTKLSDLVEIPPVGQRVKKFAYTNNDSLNPPYSDGDRLIYCTIFNYQSGNMVVTPSMVTDEGGIDVTYLADNIAVGNIKVWEYSVNRGLAEVNEVTVNEIETYNENPESHHLAVLDIQGGVLKQIFLFKTI